MIRFCANATLEEQTSEDFDENEFEFHIKFLSELVLAIQKKTPKEITDLIAKAKKDNKNAFNGLNYNDLNLIDLLKHKTNFKYATAQKLAKLLKFLSHWVYIFEINSKDGSTKPKGIDLFFQKIDKVLKFSCKWHEVVFIFIQIQK